MVSKNKLLDKLKKIKKLRTLKKIKENKGKVLAGLGITTTFAFSLKSDETLNFNLSNIHVDATINTIIIEKDTISTDDFYRNIKFSDGIWKYTNEKRSPNPYFISNRINHQLVNSQNRKKTLLKQPQLQYEDVYLSYKINESDTTDVICRIEEKHADTIMTKALGSFFRKNRKIVVRNFLADTTLSPNKREKLDSIIQDKYDTELSKTIIHEFGHDGADQKGINLRAGIAPERNYSLSMHDEVQANIKQFLAQRYDYIKTGDEKHITEKFKFYLKDIKEKGVKPNLLYISDEEAKIIGEGVRNMWNKRFRNSYKKNHYKNLRISLSENMIAYTSKDSEEMYNNILDNIYLITPPHGIAVNFRPFIKDFKLAKDEVKEIEKIKAERPLHELDKLGMINDRYGHKALHSYIKEQKANLAKRDKEQEKLARERPVLGSQKPSRNPNSQNREAVLNEQRRAIQNRKQRRSR